VKQFRCLMILGVVFNFLSMIGEFLGPYFIGLVIDEIVAKNWGGVRLLVVYWMSANAVSSVFAGIQKVIFTATTENIGRALRRDVFKQILSKDVTFFDQRRTGELISRLQSDTAKIENALSANVAIVLRSGLYNTCVTVLLFILSWKMTLFMLAVLTPALVAGPIYGKFRRRIAKEISDG
jgi:ABC-type multidrug transport system fused ATPase/permease subunit